MFKIQFLGFFFFSTDSQHKHRKPSTVNSPDTAQIKITDTLS